MDFTLSLSSDWFNLMSLPLIFITIKEVLPKWKSIWDENLTHEDRRLLLRMVMFLVLPAVVFLHESGHLLAALQVNAKVYEFHYGPLTGYVKVDSNLPAQDLLWIAVAGNLAQIVLGLVSLTLALLVRSAPWVAFLVYLGLFAIGDTVIFYAALSLASFYGDWEQIYNSPCRDLVFDIGVVHVLLVAFIAYCISSSRTRLWFTCKTNPAWTESHRKLEAAEREDASLFNCLALANSFTEAGLYREAGRCLEKAERMGGNNPGISYAKAELEMSRGNVDKALTIFESICSDDRLDDSMRAQVLLQMGEIWMYRRDSQRAINCFQDALLLDERQGDSRLHKALLKASMNNLEGLEEDIALLKDPETLWVYRSNRDKAAAEIEKLETTLARRQK